MSKQQTAVEWIIEQLVKLDKQLDGKRKGDDSTVIKLSPTKIYEQAKAMEKKQIETAYNSGQEFCTKYDDPETGEDYYTLNYGE